MQATAAVGAGDACQPEELGEHYLVQQQIGGWPLSVFKFPERVHFSAQSTMKIWTSCSDPGLYKPPTDFVFRQLVRWSVGASICTLLCQPNGQVTPLTHLAVLRLFTPVSSPVKFNAAGDIPRSSCR